MSDDVTLGPETLERLVRDWRKHALPAKRCKSQIAQTLALMLEDAASMAERLPQVEAERDQLRTALDDCTGALAATTGELDRHRSWNKSLHAERDALQAKLDKVREWATAEQGRLDEWAEGHGGWDKFTIHGTHEGKEYASIYDTIDALLEVLNG